MTPPSRATARQLARLDRLSAERDPQGLLLPRHLGGLTISAASHLITELERCPVRAGYHPPTLRTANGCVAGVYELAGDVFRLRPNREGTGLWAQQRTPRGWEYAPEAVPRLLPVHRRPDLEHTAP